MVLENTTNMSLPVIAVDKYEESVDLQNQCRSYYLSRVKASEHFKQTLQVSTETSKKRQNKTSMSTAMEKLRSEMASLVDQDLSLMKQLLTLNETIEELKHERLYGVCKDCIEDSAENIGKSSSMISVNSGH